MDRKRYHITKTNNGWQGKLENAERASVTGETKEQVMDETITMAKNHGYSQVLIHGEDGKIQEERTYPRSSDPSSSEG